MISEELVIFLKENNSFEIKIFLAFIFKNLDFIRVMSAQQAMIFCEEKLQKIFEGERKN